MLKDLQGEGLLTRAVIIRFVIEELKKLGPQELIFKGLELITRKLTSLLSNFERFLLKKKLMQKTNKRESTGLLSVFFTLIRH